MLAIGAMRYAYVGASWLLPWMQGTLPPRFWRKVVAAAQGVFLAIAAADVLAQPLLIAVLVGALALLLESFGRDVLWLWQHRPIEAARPLHAPSVDPLPITLRSTAEPTAARPHRVIRSRYRPARAPPSPGGRALIPTVLPCWCGPAGRPACCSCRSGSCWCGDEV